VGGLPGVPAPVQIPLQVFMDNCGSVAEFQTNYEWCMWGVEEAEKEYGAFEERLQYTTLLPEDHSSDDTHMDILHNLCFNLDRSIQDLDDAEYVLAHAKHQLNQSQNNCPH